MSYASLGFSCEPITIACTSNHKFLAPTNPVYDMRTTYMMKYPGDSLMFRPELEADHIIKYPEEIKIKANTGANKKNGCSSCNLFRS